MERLSIPYAVEGSLVDSDYGVARSTLDARIIADIRPEHVEPFVAALSSDTVRRSPAADLLLQSDSAFRGQTDTEWACQVTAAGSLLTVGNYYLNRPTVYVCSDLGFHSETTGAGIDTNTTTFLLPLIGSGLKIWVTTEACDR